MCEQLLLFRVFLCFFCVSILHFFVFFYCFFLLCFFCILLLLVVAFCFIAPSSLFFFPLLLFQLAFALVAGHCFPLLVVLLTVLGHCGTLSMVPVLLALCVCFHSMCNIVSLDCFTFLWFLVLLLVFLPCFQVFCCCLIASFAVLP